MQVEPTEAQLHGRGVVALLDSPYARYLDLETLFDIQVAERPGIELHHPEEVLFRSVHMASELWLRLAGHELQRVIAATGTRQLASAVALARRCVSSIDRVIENTRMLESMAAADYHIYRVHFGEASGLQSPGYAYVRQQARLMAAALDRLVDDDDALFALYTQQRDDPRYALCQALLDFDAALDRFRALHLQIARGFLGELTAGTGGQGIDYLRRNVGQQLFPRLWAVGDRIARSAGAVSYGYGNVRDELEPRSLPS